MSSRSKLAVGTTIKNTTPGMSKGYKQVYASLLNKVHKKLYTPAVNDDSLK
ncbi:hypothetical protein DOY81_011751, partial [Sarcophaga bullata]